MSTVKMSTIEMSTFSKCQFDMSKCWLDMSKCRLDMSKCRLDMSKCWFYISKCWFYTSKCWQSEQKVHTSSKCQPCHHYCKTINSHIGIVFWVTSKKSAKLTLFKRSMKGKLTKYLTYLLISDVSSLPPSEIPCHSRVIPYKSTEKNVIFFLDFWPKKSKVFVILVVKTIFKLNFGYFWPLLEFLMIFFVFFVWFKK